MSKTSAEIIASLAPMHLRWLTRQFFAGFRLTPEELADWEVRKARLAAAEKKKKRKRK